MSKSYPGALLFILLVIISIISSAQVPQKMSYQAVIRDSNSNLIMNQQVGMKISIHQSLPVGVEVYSETFSPWTNTNGLVTMEIGGGIGFDTIDWANGPFYIQVDTDPTGGVNYTVSGVSELLSVPYALYAVNSGTPGPPGPEGVQGPTGPQGIQGEAAPLADNRDSLIVLYNNPNAYGFYQNNLGQAGCAIQSMVNINHLAASSKKSIVIYNNGTAYAFYRDSTGTGSWVVQTIGNTVQTVSTSTNVIVLNNSSSAHAFYIDGAGNGVWLSQTLGGSNYSSVSHGDKIILYNFTTAYVFSIDEAGDGGWTIQTIGGTNHNVITTK